MKYPAALALMVTLGISGPIRAEGPAAGTPGVTLIEVMSDTGQALVRDEIRDEYVVVRVGDRLQAYEVSGITSNRLELTSTGERGERFVLAPARNVAPGNLELIDPYPASDIPTVVAPPQARAAQRAVDARTEPATPAAPPAAGPPAAAGDGPAVIIEAPEPRVIEGSEPVVVPSAPAPVQRHGGPAAAVPAPAPAGNPAAAPVEPSPIEPAPAPPPASFGAPAPGAAEPARREPATPEAPADPSGARAAIEAVTGRPAGAPAAAPAASSTSIQRRELNAALGDFGTLSRQLRLRLVEGGVRVEGITEGTFFHRLGLRPGDLVRRVDDRPITGIGDAAVLYGRIDRLDSVAVELERGGQPVVLRYRLVD